MKRIQSIDNFRGMVIFLMVLYHVLDWWIIKPDRWLIVILFGILGSIFASGLIFVSGFSAGFSYKRNLNQIASSTDITMARTRNIYVIRALLLLIVALIYNTVIAIAINDLRFIWAWYPLQTIAMSLLIAWPLLRTSKFLRIGLGIGLVVINDALLPFLLTFRDQLNIFGLLFQILYNPPEHFTIVSYFGVFLIGTAFGDFLFDINNIKDQEERKLAIKNRFIKTCIIGGIISTTFGIMYRFDDFFHRFNLSGFFYSIGADLIIVSILLYFEEFEIFKFKKSYRFLFFYSVYSFTIYLTHDPLYFLLYQQLNAITIWIAEFVLFVILTYLLKVIYQKLGKSVSIKSQLSKMSLVIVDKIEQRKSKKIENKLLVSQ